MTYLIVTGLSWVNSGSNHDPFNSHWPLMGKQLEWEQWGQSGQWDLGPGTWEVGGNLHQLEDLDYVFSTTFSLQIFFLIEWSLSTVVLHFKHLLISHMILMVWKDHKLNKYSIKFSRCWCWDLNPWPSDLQAQSDLLVPGYPSCYFIGFFLSDVLVSSSCSDTINIRFHLHLLPKPYTYF